MKGDAKDTFFHEYRLSYAVSRTISLRKIIVLGPVPDRAASAAPDANEIRINISGKNPRQDHGPT
jgi:hypothetical protein